MRFRSKLSIVLSLLMGNDIQPSISCITLCTLNNSRSRNHTASFTRHTKSFDLQNLLIELYEVSS